MRNNGCGFVMASLGLLAACGEELPTTSTNENEIYRDGDDWAADNGAHPQVIRVFKPIDATTITVCTAWLSSSNTMVFNAHCLAGSNDLGGWAYHQTMTNSTPTQRAALIAMGTSTGGFVHPFGSLCFNKGDDCCWGGDVAVLQFATPMPRNVMRPLAIKAASTEEPECDGDDRCVMMVGTGRTGADCESATNPGPLDSTATQIFVESGLGEGHCTFNDEMVFGEYDFDDSQGCPGDSGSPIFWRDTDEVMAVNRGRGGDGGDDLIGAVLWAGGSETARDFVFLRATDQDQDGIQAAHDNCDRVSNAGQGDFNGDTIGDACQDTDGDGILDAAEISAGTDPARADTDGDGLTDPEETTAGTDPTKADTDGDGLSDGAEVKTHRTNPLDTDSDDDGLGDGAEINTHGTDPLDTDTDNDGLTDGAEVNTHGTSPTDSDTDDDGLSDGAEVNTHGTNPLDSDTDDDGLSDGAEVNTHGTNPRDADSDDDGLSDGAEVLVYHTNPLVQDTDGDGLTDGQEVLTYGTNPLDTDTDDDALTDGQEVLVYHTDPLDPDTDDDLLQDGFEITYGLDPLDADTDNDGLIDGKDTDWIITWVNALPKNVFRSKGHRESIVVMLEQAQQLAKGGNVAEALVVLASLRTHVDGCGTRADSTDWIVPCTTQSELRLLVDVIAGNL